MSIARKMAEAKATLELIDGAFGGYPLEEDFATKEDAVKMLQRIWDIVDDYDGSMTNVEILERQARINADIAYLSDPRNRIPIEHPEAFK